MKLIDKDKIVAEIERMLHETVNNTDGSPYYGGRAGAFTAILSFINTLEVKDADLEKENIIGTLERAVKIDAGGYPYINCDIEFYDYDKDIPLAKEGDKVKVVLVKGE